MARVTVELYGVPRHRFGVAEVTVEAATARAALAGLPGVLAADGRLAPQYLLSVDGGRFVTDLDAELPAGTRLLLLSADAGG